MICITTCYSTEISKTHSNNAVNVDSNTVNVDSNAVNVDSNETERKHTLIVPFRESKKASVGK